MNRKKADTSQFSDRQNEKKNYEHTGKVRLQHMYLKDNVIDGEMLDWNSDHGIKLEDITIKNKLQYERSGSPRPSIEFNVQERKEAKAIGDYFGDVFFKLTNDAIYGKKSKMYVRQDLRIVNDSNRHIKVVETVNFEYAVVFVMKWLLHIKQEVM